jgi:hypothetical protein
MDFVNSVEKQGIETKIAVVGRDQTILRCQQERVRHQPTLALLMEQLPLLPNPIFLSYELLYLYKFDYIRSLDVNIPVAYDDIRLEKILEHDANSKYIHSVDFNPLDTHNTTGQSLKEFPI